MARDTHWRAQLALQQELPENLEAFRYATPRPSPDRISRVAGMFTTISLLAVEIGYEFVGEGKEGFERSGLGLICQRVSARKVSSQPGILAAGNIIYGLTTSVDPLPPFSQNLW